MKVYCMTCQATRDSKKGKTVKMKKGKMHHAVNVYEGKCPKCGGEVMRFVK